MNQLIIDNFKKLINLIEIETNHLIDKKQILLNKYRTASLKKSVKILSTINKKITNISQLTNIEGIGKGTLDRVNEILMTGKLIELKNYDKIIKKYATNEKIIKDLMKVIGIGRIMAKNLIDTYKIKSAEELKILSDSGKIELNDKLKIGLKYLGKFQGSIPRSEIEQIYDHLQQLTDEFDKSMFITICGSFRRKLPIMSDIDILLCSVNIITSEDLENNNILSRYILYLHEKGFLIDDITDKNIKTKYMGFGRLNTTKPIRRVDIRLIPMESYFTALIYFTGSYYFNQSMRLRAKKLGYKLNEYGLYNIETNERIVIISEQDIFDKLGMTYITPDKR
jgi:DNA polymerase/3'-5' exonuclease PolX